MEIRIQKILYNTKDGGKGDSATVIKNHHRRKEGNHDFEERYNHIYNKVVKTKYDKVSRKFKIFVRTT